VCALSFHLHTVTMFAISATAHSNPKWSGCRNSRGIFPPIWMLGLWQGRDLAIECRFVPVMTVGAQVRRGTAGMLGRQS